MVRVMRRLNWKANLGSTGNEHECLGLLDAIERSRFVIFLRDGLYLKFCIVWLRVVRTAVPISGFTNRSRSVLFPRLRRASFCAGWIAGFRLDTRLAGILRTWPKIFSGRSMTSSGCVLSWMGGGDVVYGETDDDNDDSESVVEGPAEPRELTKEEHLIAVRDYLRYVGEVPESALDGG